MRLALWIALFAVGLAGIFVPTLYLHLGKNLAVVESEQNLRARLLRSTGDQSSSTRPSSDVEFEAPDFTKLPRDLVAVYISQMGCPSFFQSPREDGFEWLWRMLSGLWGSEPPGDGRCERRLAMRLASAAGVTSGARQAVAANKIHALLQRDELIAYDLASTAFEQTVVGIQAAAKALFKKELKALQLSEIAELTLALPPHEFYDELKLCRNASLIRQSRDYVLSMLVNHTLVSSDRAGPAQAQPVACTRQ